MTPMSLQEIHELGWRLELTKLNPTVRLLSRLSKALS